MLREEGEGWDGMGWEGKLMLTSSIAVWVPDRGDMQT
jgi:hypothetical protein